MEKRILSVTQNGAVTGRDLIVPGTTYMGGADNVLDKYVRIHLQDVNLQVSGAGTVKFLLGNFEIFSRVLTAAGVIEEQYLDLYNYGNNGSSQSLKMTVIGAVDVTGTICWSVEYAGGNRVKTA
jgi:hypothetical protein